VRDEYHTYIISHQKFVLGQKIFIFDIIYAGLEIALSKTYSNLVLKHSQPLAGAINIERQNSSIFNFVIKLRHIE